MKYQIKPNQSSIHKIKPYKTRKIRAIEVNVINKTITEVKIENNIDYIQKKLDFYNYLEIIINKNLDHLFVSNDVNDIDYKKRKTFMINSDNKKYYGNALIVQIPKSYSLQKLKSTSISLNDVKEIIRFE